LVAAKGRAALLGLPRKLPSATIQEALHTGRVSTSTNIRTKAGSSNDVLQQLGAVSIERFLVKLDTQAWGVVQVKHALLDPGPASVEFEP